jgi:hypothetical protein
MYNWATHYSSGQQKNKLPSFLNNNLKSIILILKINYFLKKRVCLGFCVLMFWV